MRTADMIKSNYWRARDIEGQAPVVLSIVDVTEELFTRGHRKEVKYFLWFRESQKGLQLNAGRVKVLEAAYGPDSEMWMGRRVRLSYDPSVEFGGRAVGGIRLETEKGAVYIPQANWGTPTAPPGAPPPPVWDAKRQTWITQEPPPQTPPAADPSRPPPPVWNAATQQWETVDPGTGEVGGQMPAGRGLGVLSGRESAPAPAGDFDDDIPF